MFELSKSIGYTACRLADHADLFLSSCITHSGAISIGTGATTLASTLAMAVSVGMISWSASVRWS